MGKVDLNEGIVNGRWTQIGLSFRVCKRGNRAAVFQCQCGVKRIVRCGQVRRSGSKSCGCLNVEATKLANVTHGHASGVKKKASRTYHTWDNMIRRCMNEKATRFKNYGGRGITVCDRWLNSFEKFLEDMGERPEGTSIDRKNNDGNYEPENCHWATRREQGRNTRQNRMLTFNGVTQCLSAWAEEYGMKKYVLQERLSRGASLEKALTTKVVSRKRAVKLTKK